MGLFTYKWNSIIFKPLLPNKFIKCWLSLPAPGKWCWSFKSSNQSNRGRVGYSKEEYGGAYGCVKKLDKTFFMLQIKQKTQWSEEGLNVRKKAMTNRSWACISFSVITLTAWRGRQRFCTVGLTLVFKKVTLRSLEDKNGLINYYDTLLFSTFTVLIFQPTLVLIIATEYSIIFKSQKSVCLHNVSIVFYEKQTNKNVFFFYYSITNNIDW